MNLKAVCLSTENVHVLIATAVNERLYIHLCSLSEDNFIIPTVSEKNGRNLYSTCIVSGGTIKSNDVRGFKIIVPFTFQ